MLNAIGSAIKKVPQLIMGGGAPAVPDLSANGTEGLVEMENMARENENVRAAQPRNKLGQFIKAHAGDMIQGALIGLSTPSVARGGALDIGRAAIAGFGNAQQNSLAKRQMLIDDQNRALAAEDRARNIARQQQQDAAAAETAALNRKKLEEEIKRLGRPQITHMGGTAVMVEDPTAPNGFRIVTPPEKQVEISSEYARRAGIPIPSDGKTYEVPDMLAPAGAPKSFTEQMDVPLGGAPPKMIQGSAPTVKVPQSIYDDIQRNNAALDRAAGAGNRTGSGANQMLEIDPEVGLTLRLTPDPDGKYRVQGESNRRAYLEKFRQIRNPQAAKGPKPMTPAEEAAIESKKTRAIGNVVDEYTPKYQLLKQSAGVNGVDVEKVNKLLEAEAKAWQKAQSDYESDIAKRMQSKTPIVGQALYSIARTNRINSLLQSNMITEEQAKALGWTPNPNTAFKGFTGPAAPTAAPTPTPPAYPGPMGPVNPNVGPASPYKKGDRVWTPNGVMIMP